jgi:4'-phosphopantetheinyl transferase
VVKKVILSCVLCSKLPANEIHLYWIDATDIQYHDDDQYLDSAEKKRAAAFKFDGDRQHYQAAHNWLRQLLSRYACVPPAEWYFSYNAYGKPFIANPDYTDLQFNLSHTKGLIACAIRHDQAVGVDVEGHKVINDLAALCDYSLAERERDYVFSNADSQQQQQRFLTCWTLKEAYIKALGKGLSCPLQQFSITYEQQEWVLRTEQLGSDTTPCQSWYFLSIALPQAFCLALAIPTLEGDSPPVLWVNPKLS